MIHTCQNAELVNTRWVCMCRIRIPVPNKLVSANTTKNKSPCGWLKHAKEAKKPTTKPLHLSSQCMNLNPVNVAYNSWIFIQCFTPVSGICTISPWMWWRKLDSTWHSLHNPDCIPNTVVSNHRNRPNRRVRISVSFSDKICQQRNW